MSNANPTWEPIWLSCRACTSAWSDCQPNGVSLATWIAHMETLRCPTCGNTANVMLRTTPPDPDFDKIPAVPTVLDVK